MDIGEITKIGTREMPQWNPQHVSEPREPEKHEPEKREREKEPA